jgi:hypothetical protein
MRISIVDRGHLGRFALLDISILPSGNLRGGGKGEEGGEGCESSVESSC